MSKSLERKLDDLEKDISLPGIDISGLAENEEDEGIKLHIQSRINLYKRATATGDDRTALKALQDIAELQLLYPKNRNEPKGKPNIEQYVEALGMTAAEVWDNE